MLTVSPHGYVKLHCRLAKRFTGATTGLTIGNVATAPIAQRQPNWDIKHFLPKAEVEQIPEEFSVTRYSDMYDTILLKSLMGTGKTKALLRYLGGLEALVRVIVVSFRCSYTTDAKAKLPGFVDYRDVKGELDQMRLICQVDSLHRVKMLPEEPTLLILDEIEKIHAQFDNSLTERHGTTDANHQKFEWLMTNATKVIAMDAMAEFCSYELLRTTRKAVLMQINEWRPSTEEAANDGYYANAQAWEAAVMMALDQALEKPFVIASNSTKMAKYLVAQCQKHNPEAAIKLYCANSTQEERKDFENKHFHKVFGYFGGRSTRVKTSIQMLGLLSRTSNTRMQESERDQE